METGLQAADLQALVLASTVLPQRERQGCWQQETVDYEELWGRQEYEKCQAGCGCQPGHGHQLGRRLEELESTMQGKRWG